MCPINEQALTASHSLEYTYKRSARCCPDFLRLYVIASF
jgi:hypothetical protein